MAKKANPRRRPATMADIQRAKQEAFSEAVEYASVLYMTILADKYGMEDKLGNVWRDVNDLAEEVMDGRVTIADLKTVLKEDQGIVFK